MRIWDSSLAIYGPVSEKCVNGIPTLANYGPVSEKCVFEIPLRLIMDQFLRNAYLRFLSG